MLLGFLIFEFLIVAESGKSQGLQGQFSVGKYILFVFYQ